MIGDTSLMLDDIPSLIGDIPSMIGDIPFMFRKTWVSKEDKVTNCIMYRVNWKLNLKDYYTKNFYYK